MAFAPLIDVSMAGFKVHLGENRPESTSRCLNQWTQLNGVELDFSRLGKPTDNTFIEAFNGRFRQECLNENRFLSLQAAGEKVEIWRKH